MKKLLLLAAIAALLLLPACAAALTFTDDLGREVTIDNPQRTAALLGSFADMWYLAGGTVIASADDAWEEFSLPLGEDAVNLGMTKRLSLEKLFAADPDFVIASAGTAQNVEWMDTLEAAGITTAYFEVSSFDDYLRVLGVMTDITGRKDLYEANGLSVQAMIDATIERSRARIEESGAPTVLVLRASPTYIRAKGSSDNVLGEMLQALGCVNIADVDGSLLEQLSTEHIMIADPDFIFFVRQGSDFAGIDASIDAFLHESPALAYLTAVTENRVFVMDKALYTLKPNARWGEAYEKLEGMLAQ